MEILLYGRSSSEEMNRLEAALHSAAPGRAVRRFASLPEFWERLREFVEPDSIAVLAVANAEELKELQVNSEMLKDLHIILVLPDWRENTIRLAHRLTPRFFCRADDDFIDLNQIVGKLARASA